MKPKNYLLTEKCCAKCKYLGYYLTAVNFYHICDHPFLSQELPWDKEICLAGICDWYKPSSKVSNQNFDGSFRQVNAQENTDKLQIVEGKNA